MSGFFVKGDVSVEHTVWCANMETAVKTGIGIFPPTKADNYNRCHGHDQQPGTVRVARKEWIAQGWRQTTKYGWLCPRCYARFTAK